MKYTIAYLNVNNFGELWNAEIDVDILFNLTTRSCLFILGIDTQGLLSSTLVYEITSM